MGSSPSTSNKFGTNGKYTQKSENTEVKRNNNKNNVENKRESTKINHENDKKDIDEKVNIINSKEDVIKLKDSEGQTTHKSADGTQISLPNTSDYDSSQSNYSHDTRTDLQESKEGKKKRKAEEENRQNDEKHHKLEASLKESLQDLKRKYNDAEICPGTVVRAFDPAHNKENIAARLWEKESKLKVTKQQKDKLLNRLSELASARLRYNNPDIADLSDENRATKLAEKLSELYDNEWTDLFEVTKQQNAKLDDVDKSIAEGLRDVLKFCYEECQRVVADQRNRLYFCLNENQTKEVPQGLQMRIKEFQKIVPQYSFTRIKKVVSERASEHLKQNIIVKYSKKTKKHYEKYINICIDIAWHTQIQDPPLKLDFDSSDTDLSSFRPYISSGPHLDYVLWPALLLHEKGSVVAKGVAQFKTQSDTRKNENTKEQQSDKNTFKPADSDWNDY